MRVTNELTGGNIHFKWDNKGNMIYSFDESFKIDRRLCWTEDNRLQGIKERSDLTFPEEIHHFLETGLLTHSDVSNMSAYYNYTANGERNLKLTSLNQMVLQNSENNNITVLVSPILYASSLITLNPRGYTKHYFEEGRRICSKIGGGFKNVIFNEIIDTVPALVSDYHHQYNIQKEGIHYTFKCLDSDVEISPKRNLCKMLYEETLRDEKEPTFYYHNDHLGSAAYLTDMDGGVAQTLNYLPYGEDWVDINHSNPILGQYTFNGKEKDYESGYHYYGSRYYNSELSMWLSVDPMSGKYPSLNPYVYCANNPVKLIDPNGEEIDISNLSEQEKEQYNKNICILKQNKMFQTYYAQLERSDTKYIIKSGRGAGGSGSFNPKTNEVHSIDNLYVLSQELFHAYQSDINVYSSQDLSVRETEADIVSQNVVMSLGRLNASTNEWDNNMSINEQYVDNDFNFMESILSSKQFDNDFNYAVNKRINQYKERKKKIK